MKNNRSLVVLTVEGLMWVSGLIDTIDLFD